MTSSDPSPVEADSEGTAELIARPHRRPPFTFCKRNGVLVTNVEGDRAQVLYRPGATATALVEVRRFLGIPLQMEKGIRYSWRSARKSPTSPAPPPISTRLR